MTLRYWKWKPKQKSSKSTTQSKKKDKKGGKKGPKRKSLENPDLQNQKNSTGGASDQNSPEARRFSERSQEEPSEEVTQGGPRASIQNDKQTLDKPKSSRKNNSKNKGKKLAERISMPILEQLEKDLQNFKRLWLIEATEGKEKPAGYAYNVMSGKGKKILTAAPTTEQDSALGKKEKPKSYNVSSSNGEVVLFSFKYLSGSRMKQTITSRVNIDNEFAGTVNQDQNTLTVMDGSGTEIMRFVGVPLLGCCGAVEQFHAEIYLSEKSIQSSVGIMGKNPSHKDGINVGMESGLYFVASKGAELTMELIHKVFIVSTMIALMTHFAVIKK